jgi:hypothetical protein
MQARPEAFPTVWGCLVKTFKEEGITAFWKGSVPALVRGFDSISAA